MCWEISSHLGCQSLIQQCLCAHEERDFQSFILSISPQLLTHAHKIAQKERKRCTYFQNCGCYTQNHRMDWVGGDIKDHPVSPLSPGPGVSKPHLAWPWTLPGMCKPMKANTRLSKMLSYLPAKHDSSTKLLSYFKLFISTTRGKKHFQTEKKKW